MASRYQIQIHYQNALRQAAKLEQLADQLRTVADRKFAGAMEAVQTSWSGENAESFLLKGTRLKEKTIKTSNELRSAASSVRRIAENTYRAEMRALELANRRTYGGGGSR